MTFTTPIHDDDTSCTHCMTEYTITSKIQESMYRMVTTWRIEITINMITITQLDSYKCKCEHRHKYKHKQQLTRQQFANHLQTIYKNTLIKQTEHIWRTEWKRTSNILQNNATIPTVWPVPNWTLSTIELTGQHTKLFNKGLSLVPMARNAKTNEILSDLYMFTAKVSRQYKRLNDPLRLNRPDGELTAFRNPHLIKFTQTHMNWALSITRCLWGHEM